MANRIIQYHVIKNSLYQIYKFMRKDIFLLILPSYLLIPMSEKTKLLTYDGYDQNILRKRTSASESKSNKNQSNMVPRVVHVPPPIMNPPSVTTNSKDSGAVDAQLVHRRTELNMIQHKSDPPIQLERDVVEHADIRHDQIIPTAGTDSQDSDGILDEGTVLNSLSQPLIPNKDGMLNISESSEMGVKRESSFKIMAQVILPYFIAGFGMVGAGLVLDYVQHWPVYKNVSEVFILVPALLGLKGNLEMTLASRLSTASNLGLMDDNREKWKMIGGNMALTQCQAIIVGFLASVAAVLFGWFPDGEFNIKHVLLLCASSLVTASLASGILGSIMVLVILCSKKFNVNPDNIATPIAASLGDLITLALLSWISDKLYRLIDQDSWLAPSIIVFIMLLSPFWAIISHKNRYTHDVFYYGWSPVISAMIISSLGGLVLDVAIRKNPGVAVFSPVINGVGGNLVAVQASRISTDLHSLGPPGTHIPGRPSTCQSPRKVFFGNGQHTRSARVLFILVVPGQLLFLFLIAYVNAGHNSITIRVTIMYLTVALLQVGILLIIADCLIYIIWKRKNDPDNFSIPYLTALGDMIGTSLLAVGFYIVWLLGDRDIDIGD